MEAIRRQKESEDEEAARVVTGESGKRGEGRGGGGARVEMTEEPGEASSPPKVAPKPRPPQNTALLKGISSTSSDAIAPDRQVRQPRFSAF